MIFLREGGNDFFILSGLFLGSEVFVVFIEICFDSKQQAGLISVRPEMGGILLFAYYRVPRQVLQIHKFEIAPINVRLRNDLIMLKTK